MSCEHCDSSVPHDHDGVAGALGAARRTAQTLLAVQVAAAVLALGASLVAMPIAGWPLPFGWGLGTWVAATGLGALAGTSARAGRDISRPSVAMRVRLAAAVTGALVLVLGAFIAAGRSVDGRFVGGTATPGLDAWQVALAVLAGWLLAAAIAAGVQTYGWLKIAAAPGDAGELVRTGIVQSKPASLARSIAAFAVPALMLFVWILVIAWIGWLALLAAAVQVLVAVVMTRA